MSNRDVGKIFEVEEIEKSSYAEDKLLKKVDEYLKHKYVIIFLTLIIVVQILFSMKGFRFPWRIFYNKEGDFQWLAITAIAAMFTFLCTTVITVRKNKADLVAKSRIEWIQEVKKTMSVYLKDVHYYPFLFKKYKTTKSGDENLKYLKEVNELALKIEENQNLLLLHLSDNEGNKQINDCINDCTDWILNMETRWKIQSENNFKMGPFHYKDTPVTNLLRVSRDYLKKEWDKAKLGK